MELGDGVTKGRIGVELGRGMEERGKGGVWVEVKKGKGRGKASRKYERGQRTGRGMRTLRKGGNHSPYKVAHHLKLQKLRDSVSLAPWLGKRE